MIRSQPPAGMVEVELRAPPPVMTRGGSKQRPLPYGIAHGWQAPAFHKLDHADGSKQRNLVNHQQTAVPGKKRGQQIMADDSGSSDEDEPLPSDTTPTRPTASTVSLTATPSTPSLGSYTVSTASPSLGPRSPSFCSSVELASQSKAAAKSAKRRARKELNKDKRRAEAAAANTKLASNKQHPPAQPWETALDNLVCPPSISRASRASWESVHAFKVPQDRQLLLESSSPVPALAFDATHNVASAIVERLVAAYGGWSITFSDPAYRMFITVDKAAAMSFKVVGGMLNPVAVVFGDPVCHPDRLESAIHEFRAFCRANGWRSAFVGVREHVVKFADKKRWTSVEFAVEQVVDPVTNDILDGAAGGSTGKRMMLVAKKLAKDNVLRMYNPADGVDPILQAFLQGVYDRCYASKEAAKGDTSAYSTKLHLFDLPHLMTYFYTVGDDGLPNGMAGLMQVGPGQYLLDPVVAAPGAPPGTSDFLTLAAMGYLRRMGVRHMSFGLEPLREVGEIRNIRNTFVADTRLINAASYDAFGFAGKKILHDKFHPDPERKIRTFLILGSRNPLTQADGAVAICRATHLKASPVLRRLIWLLQAAQVGRTMEGMLSRLVHKGDLRKSESSPDAPSPPSTSPVQLPQVVVTTEPQEQARPIPHR